MKKNYLIYPWILVLIAFLALIAINVNSLANIRELTKNISKDDRFIVNGSAKVYAKANIARVSLGVNSGVKRTAVIASQESSEKLSKIVKALEDLGLEEKDIKTTNYSLRPIYRWTEAGGQILQGYEVDQSLELLVRDLELLNEIISLSTELGANQLSNVVFDIDDELKYSLENEARALAIKEAKEKAQLIALQSGINLGSLKGVEENNMPYSPSPYTYELGLEKAMMSDSSFNPDIQFGQNEINSNVILIYELK